MALIPISEWIDRFGMLDETADQAMASPAGDQLTRCARVSAAPTPISSARNGLSAFIKEAWARHSVPERTLRRG